MTRSGLGPSTPRIYYEALYVALAAALGHPLLTSDARPARAPGLPCAVELIS